MEACCWSTYSIHRDTQATLAILDKLDIEGEKLDDEEIARAFGFEERYHEGTLTKWQRLRSRVWILFDEPYSSSTAKCVACASVFFICLSVLCFCLKSHVPKNKHDREELLENRWNDIATGSHRAFFYLEHACNAWFTIEIALRCLVRSHYNIYFLQNHHYYTEKKNILN